MILLSLLSRRRSSRRSWISLFVLSAGLVLTPESANAQFLYGITNNGKVYEVDVTAKTTTLAFTTDLNLLNGLAFNDAGDSGNGQLFYRAGSGSTNGATGLYVWNRRTNIQTQVTVSTTIAANGLLPGQSSNATWYKNAYWYVSEGKDTLYKASISFANPNAPVVSSLDAFTNFDGTTFSAYGFGDISVSSSGMMYGSTSNRFFNIDVSSGAPSSATYQQTVTTTGSQLQIGFGGDGTTLYGTSASTGEWYTLNKTNGARTSLNFTSKDTSGAVVAFNDISEGSLRSVNAVLQPEPTSLALLLPFVPLTIWLRRRTRRVPADALPEAAV